MTSSIGPYLRSVDNGPHEPRPYAKHVKVRGSEWWELACDVPGCKAGVGPFDTAGSALVQKGRMVPLCADEETS